MVLPTTLWKGDCLTEMERIAAGSINLILCDLPYGTTDCKWDAVIPFARLWEAYRRVLTPNGAAVLTAAMPFTAALVMSNPKGYRHEWVWNKGVAGTFATAKYCPMKIHESVLVFGDGKLFYQPQMVPREKPIKLRAASNRGQSESAALRGGSKPEYDGKVYTEKYPETILHFSSRADKRGFHPTQKPVALMEYLIKTYTIPGQTVLDNCMGSGTTGVACVNTRRKFIGIELNDVYFATAQERIAEAQRNLYRRSA